MKTKFKGILTLLVAFVVQLTFAQQQTVSGTVVDENNMPLPGATVIIQGTTTGASTDFDGNYSIKANNGDVLDFSYVGYATKSGTVNGSKLDMALEPDNQLEEVIVQAYRTSTKEKSNIASTTVSASTIENRPNASFVQTLQGQVSGLQIATNNGQPGGNSLVLLRGVGSINGKTEPLFLIDGVPVDEDNFRSLNPNDIETISVLKDAGATAIYGNRGANGAIVVTTKRGSYNQPLKIKYQNNVAISMLQSHDYDLMNSREQLQLEKDYGSGFGATLSDEELATRAAQVNTDWLDVFFGTSLTQSHTLSLSAGGENANTFTSFGFTDQEGILKDVSTLKRFNFRNNVNGKSKNGKFNYATSLTLNYSESDEPGAVGGTGINRNFIIGANQSVPYISPYSYTRREGANIPVVFTNTPLFLLDTRDTNTRRDDEIKIIANIEGGYKLTDKITFKSRLGADFTDEQFTRIEAPWSFNEQLFAENGNTTPGRSDRDSRRSVLFNVTNSITYKNTFAEKHTVEASIFQEYVKGHYRSFGFRQEGFVSSTFYPGDGAAYVDDNADNDFFVDVARATVRDAGLFSVFGFLDYDYDSKYGLSASIRRDATSRFAGSNKWGTFWSVSGRWNISNENFMANSVINNLKLRASYGTSGNQDINDFGGQFAPFANQFDYLNTFTAAGAYGGVNGLAFGSGTPGAYGQIGNTDLRWETIAQANIGLDFGVWNNRLRGAFDVYKKNTTDLYLSTPIAPSINSGFTSIAANVGELENRGFEANLSYDLLRAKSEGDLGVTVKGAIAYNEQEILDLGPSGDIPFQYRVGGPLAEVFAAPYVGVNPANGNLLFEDINGNITEDINDNDQRATGKNWFPDYQGSFGLDVDYKNFYFSSQFNYVIGADRYDFDYAGFLDPTAIGQFRHSREILNAWSQPGDVTSIPSLTASNLGDDGLSDRFLRSADFLRLRNIQLGYNFSQKLMDRIGFSSAKLFITGENLVTFTSWKGFDVEQTISASNGYPTPRTYSLGLEFEF